MFTRTLTAHEYAMRNLTDAFIRREWRYRWFKNLAQTAMLQDIYEYETLASDGRVLHRGSALRPGEEW